METETKQSLVDGVLLEYQRRWKDDKHQIKVYEKSRRIGASYAEAADAALYAARTNGGNVWYMGQDKESAQRFISDAAQWALHYDVACSEVSDRIFKDADKDILMYVVRFDSGHHIHALPSVPAKLRSKGASGERFVFDECAFHDDFDGLLKAALAMLIWGCQLRFLSTHNGAANPFNQLVEDIRAGKKLHRRWSLHRTTFSDAVADGLYQRICLRTHEQWTPEAEAAWVAETRADYGDHAAEELDVIPSAGSGVWLTRALIEARMVECERVEIGA